MATNLLKRYNDTLDLHGYTQAHNILSIRGVFNQDIQDNLRFRFRNKQIQPTTADGEDKMDRLFRHLTTEVVDKKTRQRSVEFDRAVRIHWIKYHIEERKADKMLIFSVEDERRTYILDKEERYVVILEPLRIVDEFYLLTAYRLLPSNYRAMLTKFEKRGKEGLL